MKNFRWFLFLVTALMVLPAALVWANTNGETAGQESDLMVLATLDEAAAPMPQMGEPSVVAISATQSCRREPTQAAVVWLPGEEPPDLCCPADATFCTTPADCSSVCNGLAVCLTRFESPCIYIGVFRKVCVCYEGCN